MAFDALSSPVVVDGIVTDEKVAELLGLQTEYPELDYKTTIDLASTEGKVELAKDVGALQARGGYILIGVNGDGTPSGQLDGADARRFDEANLVPALLRWLPEPLTVRSRTLERDGHVLAVLYVGPHPGGCAFFRADGMYLRDEEEVVVFRAGDVFWRDGTRSVRMTQRGLEEVIARRVNGAKREWLQEQHQIRQREQAELEAAYGGSQIADAPLGAASFDLDSATLAITTLELLRRSDDIALRHLLGDGLTRARELIARNELDETALADVLDKVTCIAATFLEYERLDWLGRAVALLTQIYSMPLGPHDAEAFGYSGTISPREKAPRVWLLIMERVYGLGALAVRREQWAVVRLLTLQRPARLTDYNPNWLRHALTMVSRAQHLEEQRDGGRVSLSLLALARAEVTRLACLRPDGLSPEDEEITTSLAQFDLLSNVAAIDGAGSAEGRVFYSNFARFRQTRIQGIAERLLRDDAMRQALFPRSDTDLALALAAIGERAQQEGWQFDGFEGWSGTAVEEFIRDHPPHDGAGD